ncbi:protein fem-1 homolog C-like [Macrobrachium nipponense]|uniref:protein fem-1 homolog C-like n=1 Tax=Macrobrachium nipponense TaxID=159736 RepID=UPI0030C8CDBC
MVLSHTSLQCLAATCIRELGFLISFVIIMKMRMDIFRKGSFLTERKILEYALRHREWSTQGIIQTLGPIQGRPGQKTMLEMVEMGGPAAEKNSSSPLGTEHCHEEAKEEERSLLCMAALRGHENFVRFLVESQNAHIEELGTVAVRGFPVPEVRALWCASVKGHYRIVEFLLSKGANPNGVTTFESSPLRAACEQGHLHTVRLLVQHGADIDATNESCVTSLMIASFYGYLEIVKCLLDAGADVNSKNKNGKSALHYCSEAGHVEVMKACWTTTL